MRRKILPIFLPADKLRSGTPIRVDATCHSHVPVLNTVDLVTATAIFCHGNGLQLHYLSHSNHLAYKPISVIHRPRDFLCHFHRHHLLTKHANPSFHAVHVVLVALNTLSFTNGSKRLGLPNYLLQC